MELTEEGVRLIAIEESKKALDECSNCKVMISTLNELKRQFIEIKKIMVGGFVSIFIAMIVNSIKG